jgi:hypothetical protein
VYERGVYFHRLRIHLRVWRSCSRNEEERTNVRRFDFREHNVKDVSFETVGMRDFDCCLKVAIGPAVVSIDIKREQQDAGIIVYKILSALSAFQEGEQRVFSLAVWLHPLSNQLLAILGVQEKNKWMP